MGEVLTRRNKRILGCLIDEYIYTAEPVGSRKISKKRDMDLSSATIRNILSDLEEMGYLHQPHTSAGRIPTEKGLRYYVDSILHVKKLTSREKGEIRRRYQISGVDISNVMKKTSKMLSGLSHHVSLLTAPRFIDSVLQYIEFIRIDRDRVPVICVSKNGTAQNKVIEVEEDYSQEQLDKYSRYLDDILSGCSLPELRDTIAREMEREKNAYDSMLSQALKLGHKALSTETESEIYIDGTINIFDYPEFLEIEKMKNLFNTFEEKSCIITLLDKAISAEGVQIFIGSETKLKEMEGCSLITSPYKRGNYVIGTLGVIGPKRMEYVKVIPIVDYTATLLSEALAFS
jgi:heat-inducible transcriptional repressor